MNPKDTLKEGSFTEFKNLPDKNLFSTGIGINPTEGIPIRFFAYLLPVIAAVREKAQSIGQFYTADQGAMRLGIDPNVVQYNTDLIVKSIPSFIEEFFPKIQERIIVSLEKQNETEKILQERERLITELVSILKEKGTEKIKKFAKNRSGDMSYRYMVEHGFYAGDPITQNNDLFLIETPERAQDLPIVMIGGEAEKIFYEARKTIARALEKNPNTQLFTGIGRLPPYYQKFGEGLVGKSSIPDDISSFLQNCNPDLRKDFLTLLIACSESKNFEMFEKGRKKNPNSDDLEMLQDGLRKLNIFVSNL